MGFEVIKYLLILGLFLTFKVCSEKHVQIISDDVKIEYNQNGLVKIYSIDSGKQNHHFSLKLESISNGKQNSILEAPLSFSKTDNSIIYHWNENIKDEWQLVNSNIIRKLTMKITNYHHQALFMFMRRNRMAGNIAII